MNRVPHNTKGFRPQCVRSGKPIILLLPTTKLSTTQLLTTLTLLFLNSSANTPIHETLIHNAIEPIDNNTVSDRENAISVINIINAI